MLALLFRPFPSLKVKPSKNRPLKILSSLFLQKNFFSNETSFEFPALHFWWWNPSNCATNKAQSSQVKLNMRNTSSHWKTLLSLSNRMIKFQPLFVTLNSQPDVAGASFNRPMAAYASHFSFFHKVANLLDLCLSLTPISLCCSFISFSVCVRVAVSASRLFWRCSLRNRFSTDNPQLRCFLPSICLSLSGLIDSFFFFFISFYHISAGNNFMAIYLRFLVSLVFLSFSLFLSLSCFALLSLSLILAKILSFCVGRAEEFFEAHVCLFPWSSVAA